MLISKLKYLTSLIYYPSWVFSMNTDVVLLILCLLVRLHIAYSDGLYKYPMIIELAVSRAMLECLCGVAPVEAAKVYPP